jgi:hypothetical protein
MMQYLGEEHVREKMKFNGCIMWIKQCHKPAIWEWFIPRMKMVKIGMVYPIIQH